MTPAEVKAYIAAQLAVPVTEVSKLINSYNAVIDLLTSQIATIIPDWTSALTFNMDGSGAGIYCKHAATDDNVRIFESLTNGNINHEPPTNPTVHDDAYWSEVSASASAPIPEWAPGIFGPGLIIVFHNHSVDGRGLYVLLEPVRPFNSADIEAEITAGKWELISGGGSGSSDLTAVLTIGNDAGANPITNLADPTNPQDADTKAARDAAIVAALEGLKWKAPVNFASTANVVLSGIQTVDGNVWGSGNSGLIKNQTAPEDNGIYDCNSSGAWTRRADCDTGNELIGAIVTVLDGTANNDTTWVQTASFVSFGITPILFSQIGTTTPDASETVKGKAELLDQTESETVATSGTSGGADHTRVVSGRGLWWFWAKIKTLTQTISGVWTFSSSPIVPTASSNDNSTKAASTAYVDVPLALKENAANKSSNLGTMNATLYPTTDALFQERQVTGATNVLQSDNGGVIYFNSVTPFNFTIEVLTVKTKVQFINIGAGVVTFVNGSGVAYTGVSSLADGSSTPQIAVLIYKVAATPMILQGGGGSGWGLTGNTLTGDGIFGTLSNHKTLIYQNNTQIGEFDKGTASSSLGKLFNLIGALTATANNDVLVAAKFNPTFSVGAFTGVKKGYVQIGPDGTVDNIIFHNNSSSKVAQRFYGSTGNSFDMYQSATSMTFEPSASTSYLFKSGSGGVINFAKSDGTITHTIDPDEQLGSDVTSLYSPIITRTNATASSTATQQADGTLYFRGTYWTGSVEEKRGVYIRTQASTSANESGNLIFGHNINAAATPTDIFTINSLSGGTYNLTNSKTFSVQSVGTSFFTLNSNGNIIQFGAGTNTYIAPITTNNTLALSSPIGLRFRSDAYTNATTNATNINWAFQANQTRSTGTGNAYSAIVTIGHAATGFDPTSGAAPFYNLKLDPIVNQTGTASGPMYMLYGQYRKTAVLGSTYGFVYPDADFGGHGAGDTPSAIWHVGAGSATKAQLKLDASTILTTAVSGVCEYDGVWHSTKASGLRYTNGGVIFDNVADANNSGTDETDLYSYTTPVSTLANTGEKLKAKYAGTFSDSTATVQIKVVYGGNTIFDSGAITLTGTGSWDVEVLIIRTGSSTARSIIRMTTNAATVQNYVTETDITGLTFTNTNILKITGTAGGAGGGSNDITAKLGLGQWLGAAAN